MASSGNASAPVHMESGGCGSNSSGSSSCSNSNVPQWKRDLIQRRRQQTKVLTSSGASVKLCSAVIGSPTTEAAFEPFVEQCSAVRNGNNATNGKPQVAGDGGTTSSESLCGATVLPSVTLAGVPSSSPSPAGETRRAGQSVACNMRLEADLLLCSESDDVSNGTTMTTTVSYDLIMERKSTEDSSCESLRSVHNKQEQPFKCITLKSVSIDAALQRRQNSEECESDSSEELHYGPGIVNKLKSKYLNLTLREMNKSRPSAVQRFRRAASLEDLLDCNTEDSSEKSIVRKYTKKNANVATATKTDRYRNASRGNESMKRARSVETLLRYNSNNTEDGCVVSRFVKQESVNDHIILIDRSAVKIESRLTDVERPRVLNKPKRVKPVLAETERPPPDLVKTTMRIFEGSARRLKPKGEVAAKVATFKTINDTLKAQNQRKIIPKSQSKFSNGAALRTTPTSPKKIVLQKENHDEQQQQHWNDGVITEPIVQSVSSVVSKFQQIEKSQSPSSSPEPSHYKIKFSPAPSPEPNFRNSKTPLEVNVKSPPITPISSPKITSPCVSPKKIQQEVSIVSETIKEAVAAVIAPEDNREDAVEKTEKDDMEEGNIEAVDGPKTISKSALDNIGKAGTTMEFTFSNKSNSNKSYLPGATQQNGQSLLSSLDLENESSDSRLQERLESDNCEDEKEDAPVLIETVKPIGAVSSLGSVRSTTTTSYPQGNESKMIRCQKSESSSSPPQKQIGIIRPLVSTKTQLPQQNLSNRELEKNLINRVKSIEQPTKVVVSLKSAEEIQPVKKGSPGSGGLWDTKPWNQQNNTMVFNFSNRKDVPDYIENDGLIIRRKRDKSKVGESGIIVLDNSLDISSTEESDWEISAGPPSPCDVVFFNDNVLINGRSNLSRQPRNHKHRIQFDDTATRTFEYPSEASMLEGEGTSVDGETSGSGEQFTTNGNRMSSSASATSLPSVLGGGGLANYTPSKVDLTSEGFELGITRATVPTQPAITASASSTQPDSLTEVDYLKPVQDAGAWGSETTVDLLF